MAVTTLLFAVVNFGQAIIGPGPDFTNILRPTLDLPKALRWLLPKWFVSEFTRDIVDDLRDLASESAGSKWWILVLIEFFKLVFVFGLRRFQCCQEATSELEPDKELCAVDIGVGNHAIETPDMNNVLAATVEMPTPTIEPPPLDDQQLLKNLGEVLGSYIGQDDLDLAQFADGVRDLVGQFGYLDQLGGLMPRLSELQPSQAEVSREEFFKWLSALVILREILAERQRVEQAESNRNSAGANAEEEEEEEEEEEDDDEESNNPLAGQRFIKALWNLGYGPHLMVSIQRLRRFQTVDRIAIVYICVQDVIKPKFIITRDKVVGAIKNLLNSPLMVVLLGQKICDGATPNAIITKIIMLIATIFVPIVWSLGIIIFFLKLYMRPTKALEVVGLDDIVE
ncbi:MAG: hypothetical protein IIA92_08990 [Chloroflexi bacterium]|nr:hypothetical protein [Chloroflexota bacterium]